MTVPNNTPDLPDAILKASAEHRLVLFIGAGLSCAAGLRDWRDLKDTLISNVQVGPGQDLGTLRQNLAGLGYYECFSEIKKQDPDSYRQVMRDFLTPATTMKQKFKNLFNHLKTLDPISVVTLNMDTFLLDDETFAWAEKRKIGQCWPWEISQRRLFFFHGYVSHVGGDEEKWVFNREELESRYDKHDDASRFLHGLFSGHYTVLFVGFSFSDQKLLTHALLPKFTQDEIYGITKNRKPFHYALIDSVSADNEDSGCNKNKLKNYGIEPIIYKYLESDPLNSYSNFDRTLESWASGRAVVTEQSPSIPEEGPPIVP